MVAFWIALNISYYGLFLWMPFVLQGETSFQINVCLLLALAALSQFPGYGAAIWLVERIGRKPTLVAFLLLGGVSAYAFAVAGSATVYVIALFFVGFSSTSARGERSIPTPPSSSQRAFARPRSERSRASARGGDRRPVHLRPLEGCDRGTTWSITFIALVMAGGGIVASLLGRETRGRKLL